MSTKRIRWGILGTGDVCSQFVSDLRAVPDADAFAVASRTTERAQRFALENEVPCYHGSYLSLAQNPDVDIVYVGTPHTLHCGDVTMCLANGKHVLCEKPLGTALCEGISMASAARVADRFLMEAVWTHFFPAMRQVRQWLADGVIGEVQFVRADMNHAARFCPDSRLFDPQLGGGALLDLGVYPLTVAQMAFGHGPEDDPEILHAWKQDCFTGVDIQNAVLLRYPNGGVAQLTAGLDFNLPQNAVIAGSEGYIEIPHSFSQPDAAYLVRKGEKEVATFDRQGFGYHFEAEHVTRCLLEGKRESDVMPLNASLSLLRTLDRLREAWNEEETNEADLLWKGGLSLWS